MNRYEEERLSNVKNQLTITCRCGHRIFIPIYVKKELCKWCGNYVFRDKNLEFQYRLNANLSKK